MENVKALVVPIHSTSDIITNSSSELFICGTDRTVEKVANELQIILDMYNKISMSNLDFDMVFQPVELVDSVYNLGIGDYAEYHHFEHIDKYHRNSNGKLLIIRSMGDNAIPYELFDLIESIYNGYRIHLG